MVVPPAPPQRAKTGPSLVGARRRDHRPPRREGYSNPSPPAHIHPTSEKWNPTCRRRSSTSTSARWRRARSGPIGEAPRAESPFPVCPRVDLRWRTGSHPRTVGSTQAPSLVGYGLPLRSRWYRAGPVFVSIARTVCKGAHRSCFLWRSGTSDSRALVIRSTTERRGAPRSQIVRLLGDVYDHR